MKIPVLNIGQFPGEQEDDFYANDFASHIKAHHRHVLKPHKHDFYLIFLFTEGRGTHEIDFQSFPIRRGSVFMLYPGQTHHWEFSSDTNGYVILHSKAFYDRCFNGRSVDDFPFFYSSHNSPCISLPNEELKAIEAVFSEILEEYRSDKPLRQQKIGSLTDLLYIGLTRNYVQNHQAALHLHNVYQERLRELEHYIDKNYRLVKSPAAYAAMMHMSTRHLNRITQMVLGKTTTDLITDRVLLEAQRMLSHTRISVAEVAEYLGYEHSYFSRLFRKKLGMAPSSFADRYQKNQMP